MVAAISFISAEVITERIRALSEKQDVKKSGGVLQRLIDAALMWRKRRARIRIGSVICNDGSSSSDPQVMTDVFCD